MTRSDTNEREAADLLNARAGDHDAFMRAVAPYRNELHRHCYRMTGSVDDADDILQETLFRAWRGLGTYAGRSSFRAWLYRIATNRSIDALGGRARREVAVAWEGQEEGLEPMWLQPYPDDPADVVERREHIATAFVTAIQALPPGQRAALLLKDVLGFSVPDIADALETTRAAVNSSLQRARATVGEATTARPSTDAETALRDQLMDAWHRADLDALTSLMTSDIVLTMPPDPVRFDGPDAIVAILESVAPEGRIDLMRLLPTTANQQPAMGLYLPDGKDNGVPQAIVVLGTRDGKIARMTGFRLPPSHFPRHGLPDSVQTG